MLNKNAVSYTEGVTLVILDNAPSSMDFVAHVFERLSNAGINVDMISQNPPTGEISALSFSISDDSLAPALKVISELRRTYAQIKPYISSNNCKILISDEDMRTKPGVAAKVFRTTANAGVDIRLITTSETEISLLVTKSDADILLNALNRLLEE